MALDSEGPPPKAHGVLLLRIRRSNLFIYCVNRK